MRDKILEQLSAGNTFPVMSLGLGWMTLVWEVAL